MYYALKSKKTGKLARDHWGKVVGFDNVEDANTFIDNYRNTSRSDVDLSKYYDVVESKVASRSGDNNASFDC